MDVVQLQFSVLTIKLIGYFLCMFFAVRAFRRLNNLNIDIDGKLVKIEVYPFVIPLFILLVSPIFEVLYEVYGVHYFQNVSIIVEGIAGIIFAFAFLRLYKSLQGD
jgi:hypothetical protein